MDLDLGANLSTTEIFRAAESRPYLSLWVLSIVTVLIFWYNYGANPLSKVPLVTEKTIWGINRKKAKELFVLDARGVVDRGFKKVFINWL